MDLHVLHGEVALEVDDERLGQPRDLTDLLSDLSFVRSAAPASLGSRLVLSVHTRTDSAPLTRHATSEAEGLQVTAVGEDLYVTDGESLIHVQGLRGRATAQIAPTFEERPLQLRQRFWAHGVLKLLRQQGLYGLHAAGVITPHGHNLLIVGPSGCGKSTMTIGLIRSGGRFLSDDAILLRAAPDQIEALTLRKPFSVDVTRAADYPDFVPRFVLSSGSDRRKCRADALYSYPSQHVHRFRPDVILFPRIVAQPTSMLQEIPRSVALQHLLSQSGPELFDRPTMAAHLDLLGRVLRQTTTYELRAGQDLHRDPQSISDLLAHSQGRSACPDSSSN